MKSRFSSFRQIPSRPISRLITLCAMVALSGCAEQTEPFVLFDRLRGPPPESKWNTWGIWSRVAGDPPTYLPTGYPVRAPRDASAGSWVIDKRDGKRFFIPKKGANGYNRAVLQAETKEILRWH